MSGFESDKPERLVPLMIPTNLVKAKNSERFRVFQNFTTFLLQSSLLKRGEKERFRKWGTEIYEKIIKCINVSRWISFAPNFQLEPLDLFAAKRKTTWSSPSPLLSCLSLFRCGAHFAYLAHQLDLQAHNLGPIQFLLYI